MCTDQVLTKWENSGNTARTCQGNWKTGDILNVPSISPKFPQNLLKVVQYGWNFKDILNVPLRNILGPSFWFILNFTDWEHCDHTAGNITKEILNEPLEYFLDTFFGKISDVPMMFLMGTPWSHDLEHCECTDHFLTQEHCRETGWEHSEWM